MARTHDISGRATRDCEAPLLQAADRLLCMDYNPNESVLAKERQAAFRLHIVIIGECDIFDEGVLFVASDKTICCNNLLIDATVQQDFFVVDTLFFP